MPVQGLSLKAKIGKSPACASALTASLLQLSKGCGRQGAVSYRPCQPLASGSKSREWLSRIRGALLDE